MIKILAVDDEERILKLIRNALEKEGYEVDAVSDPLRIKKMRLQEYKLILLDVMMPGMDGFTLCEEIRDLADCPILFLTAKTEEKESAGMIISPSPSASGSSAHGSPHICGGRRERRSKRSR